MKYKKYWSCLHDNPHNNQVNNLNEWVAHMEKIFDFWPVAYYPYSMVDSNLPNFKVEGLLSEEKINSDWEVVRKETKKANENGFCMFMGYEWQGTGEDGDHNVFFLSNEMDMYHPKSYKELYEKFKGSEVIAIPHHLAYKIGNRGKNWETQNDEFSPFAEVYSSHGSSESDLTPLEMNTHIHMGPRNSETSYIRGLSKGNIVGCICSGDNHIVPGQYENGTMCCLAEEKTKESIFDALKNRRVYGVTKGRIDVDFTIDDNVMGSIIKKSKNSLLNINIVGDSAIDRVEIYKNDILYKSISHKGTWEQNNIKEKFKIKFRTEFGWGPDMRIFNDIYKKNWDIILKTSGKILDVQKCWNNFGQDIIEQNDNEFIAKLTTYKSSGAGKWMGQAGLKNEGFVFELLVDLEDFVEINANNKIYKYKVTDLLKDSFVEADLKGADDLIKERFGKLEDIRNDAWWHNSYKFKIHQAIPDCAYQMNYSEYINTEEIDFIRVKVYQENGAIAFISPIFFKED